MEPEEYYVYKSLFRSLVEALKPPRLVVYLDVSAEEAIKRIKQRGREDELKMPESYWRDLHQVYTQYYDNYRLSPLLRVDVTGLDFVNNLEDRRSVVKIIKDWYQGENIQSQGA